jgi:hypothetical protein
MKFIAPGKRPSLDLAFFLTMPTISKSSFGVPDVLYRWITRVAQHMRGLQVYADLKLDLPNIDGCLKRQLGQWKRLAHGIPSVRCLGLKR